MKYFLLTALLLTQATDPLPWTTDHFMEPPAGWMCHRPDIDQIGKATEEEQQHWCNCERVCDEDTQVVHNDLRCSVACHEDHCACDVSNAKRCMPDGQ